MIKNLIFDIGNVLMEYRGYILLEESGLTREEAKAAGDEMFNDPTWSHLDLGHSIASVLKEYQELYPQYNKNITYVLTHSEEMPIYWEDVWEKVHALKEAGYHIYILSNYSREMLEIHTDGLPFWKDVDGAVISADCHMIKPHAEIYDYLLNKYQLKAEECAYFDDRKENTGAATERGILSYTIVNKNCILELLDEYLKKAEDLKKISKN